MGGPYAYLMRPISLPENRRAHAGSNSAIAMQQHTDAIRTAQNICFFIRVSNDVEIKRPAFLRCVAFLAYRPDSCICRACRKSAIHLRRWVAPFPHGGSGIATDSASHSDCPCHPVVVDWSVARICAGLATASWFEPSQSSRCFALCRTRARCCRLDPTLVGRACGGRITTDKPSRRPTACCPRYS